MAFCKHCGEQLPEEAKFCPACGQGGAQPVEVERNSPAVEKAAQIQIAQANVEGGCWLIVLVALGLVLLLVLIGS